MRFLPNERAPILSDLKSLLDSKGWKTLTYCLKGGEIAELTEALATKDYETLEQRNKDAALLKAIYTVLEIPEKLIEELSPVNQSIKTKDPYYQNMEDVRADEAKAQVNA